MHSQIVWDILGEEKSLLDIDEGFELHVRSQREIGMDAEKCNILICETPSIFSGGLYRHIHYSSFEGFQ
jgi:hypothetical protein